LFSWAFGSVEAKETSELVTVRAILHDTEFDALAELLPEFFVTILTTAPGKSDHDLIFFVFFFFFFSLFVFFNIMWVVLTPLSLFFVLLLLSFLILRGLTIAH